jgi:arsenate reductase (thioredoxin)
MTELLDPMQAAPLELRPLIRSGARRLADEFAGVLGNETIQRYVAESYTALHGAKVPNFVPLFVERFARQQLKALARMEGLITTTTPMVVFLCVHNAGRSQIAAGWTQHLAGEGVEVFSGGSDPASEVNPAAVEAMREIGIDIAEEFPKPWTDGVVQAADAIITMGCGDACPIFQGKRYEDWAVPDPAGLGVEAVRPIRDEIGRRVRTLLGELGVDAVR